MGRLPPAEKLSLALRKNVRDEWDNNKADLEKELSGILGTTWTVEAEPNAIWPYHNDGYAKESLGSCIKGYIAGAIYQLKYQTEKYEGLADDINEICHAHVLRLDLEEQSPPRFSYSGGDVQDGKLCILFVEKNLGTNIDYALAGENLLPALNRAPTERPISFTARLGIRTEYDPTINDTRKKIAELLGKKEDEITITPNFEDSFAKLSAASKVKGSDLRDDWQSNLGSFTLKYFEAVAYQMNYIKVGDDEMIQEGFLDAVSKLEFAFRIVDQLHDANSSYCEVQIDDGVLYIQCPANKWGVNIDYVASKLMDLL